MKRIVLALVLSLIVVDLDASVTNFTVKAGKKPSTDSVKFSGILKIEDEDVLASDSINIGIVSNDMPQVNWQFPVDGNSFRKGNFISKVGDCQLKFSTKNGKLSFAAKNEDFTGLGCPITVKLVVGDAELVSVLDSDIVNGKKPCPPQFMMGVRNSMVVEKSQVKFGNKPGTDSVNVKGFFTIATKNYNKNEPVVIELGNYSFVIPGEQFKRKNSTESCSVQVVQQSPLVVNSKNVSDTLSAKNIVSDVTSLVKAKFDFLKGEFQIQIKNASIMDAGNVNFTIDCFDNELPAQRVAVEPKAVDVLDLAVSFTEFFRGKDIKTNKNGTITVPVIISNINGAAFDQTVETSLYLLDSNGNKYSIGFSIDKIKLSANKDRRISVSASIKNVPDGEYYFYVTIDVEDNISANNESRSLYLNKVEGGAIVDLTDFIKDIANGIKKTSIDDLPYGLFLDARSLLDGKFDDFGNYDEIQKYKKNIIESINKLYHSSGYNTHRRDLGDFLKLHLGDKHYHCKLSDLTDKVENILNAAKNEQDPYVKAAINGKLRYYYQELLREMFLLLSIITNDAKQRTMYIDNFLDLSTVNYTIGRIPVPGSYENFSQIYEVDYSQLQQLVYAMMNQLDEAYKDVVAELMIMPIGFILPGFPLLADVITLPITIHNNAKFGNEVVEIAENFAFDSVQSATNFASAHFPNVLQEKIIKAQMVEGKVELYFKGIDAEFNSRLTVSPSISSFLDNGGNGRVSVSSNMPWVVFTNDSWITLDREFGNNDDTVNYTVTANTGSARSGIIKIVGGGIIQYVKVNQEPVVARLTITPTSADHNSDSATGSFSVSSNVSWVVSTNNTWITLGKNSGKNNETVNYAVSANTGSSRTGTITITGGGITHKFTLRQNPPNTLAISKENKTHTSSSGTGSISVSSNVSWSASKTASWITITSGSTGSNKGTVKYSVSANTGSARSGTITISGGGITRIFTVSQDAPIVLTISPESRNHSSSSGTGNISVSSNVSWSVKKSASWITINTGSSGSSNETVNYYVSANSGSARSGTIKISGGGITRTFTVNQDPGISGSITVTAPSSGVQWQRGTTQTIRWTSSGSVGKVRIQLQDSYGNLQGDIVSSVANSGSYSWSISTNGLIGSGYRIRISDVNNWGGIYGLSNSFSLISGGSSGTLTISPSSRNHTSSSGTGNISVSSNVSWSVSKSASWITINTGSSGSGDETVNYYVSANTGSARSETITITGGGITRTFTVSQDGGSSGTINITWVSINNSGFSGQMSRYETTNAQFAKYLNDALASGDITVSGNYVKGAKGAYSGENYYRLDGPGYTFDGATNGGKSRISFTGGAFTVDSGFGNHPVTYVSWYGATAFASYYGWRLPTENEWQAAASYGGAYTYGTGNTINNNIANYRGSYHPHGTTPVGQYGTFGYGLADMAGNMWEWTSTGSGSSRVLRGGGWDFNDDYCTVSRRYYGQPGAMYGSIGFRVCR